MKIGAGVALTIVVLITVIKIREALGYQGLLGGLNSSDGVIQKEIADSEDRQKQLQVETKEQLEDIADKNREIELDDSSNKTEEIKRSIELENEQSEQVIIGATESLARQLSDKIDDIDAENDSDDSFYRLRDANAKFQRGERIEDYELQELNQALVSGFVTITRNGTLIRNRSVA